jgi:sucrose phosphorylase
MTPTIESHLRALYGPEVAERWWPEFAARLERFRRETPPTMRLPAKPLTERDVLLIAYPDQVRQDGEAPLQTMARFAAGHLRDVVSGIHLLPFYPWSSDDGFAVKDLFAVAREFGTWADVRRLGADFDLMFDAVFNHLSAQGDWFQRFLADDPAWRDFFVTVGGDPDLSAVIRPRATPLLTEFAGRAGPRRVWTTFGADQVDLNYANPAVLAAVLEALLCYVRHGAVFIRLDAVAFLWKEIGTCCLHLAPTHRIVQFLRAVVDEVAPHVRLVTETNVPHQENVSYFGDGTNEAHLVYNFALPPLVLHAALTGDATRLTRWAQALAVPSDRVTFLNFLASHDGIGLNPARGILDDSEVDVLVQHTRANGGLVSYKRLPDGSDAAYELNINYLDAVSPARAGEPPLIAARRFLTTQAVMLSLQGVPGIYFHSLIGSRGDAAGAAATGLNRRINREKLERTLLESELAATGSLRATVYAGYRDLLNLRRSHPAFAPAAAQHVLDVDRRVFAVVRETADHVDRMLCLHNLSADPVTITCPFAPSEVRYLEPHACAWVVLR